MIIHHTGDCEWTCRCPGSYAYEVHREKTPASCHMLCRGGFVSPDEIDESYNLIEPSNILKKKEFVRSSLRDILLRGINEGEDLDWNFLVPRIENARIFPAAIPLVNYFFPYCSNKMCTLFADFYSHIYNELNKSMCTSVCTLKWSLQQQYPDRRRLHFASKYISQCFKCNYNLSRYIEK